jgi:hypothetical protein
MKVTKIEQQPYSPYVYEVTLTPNFIEKFFGIKEKIKRFKDTKDEYLFGGGVYINEEGEYLGNGHWIGEKIDKFKRKF